MASDWISNASSGSKPGVLELVDLEINDLAVAMRRFREFQNSFRPISRLPPEILVDIFEILSLDLESYSNYHSEDCKCAGEFCIGVHWIGVTYVCRRWRNAALADASLWAACVNVRTCAALEALLARSKQSSLHLELKFDPNDLNCETDSMYVVANRHDKDSQRTTFSLYREIFSRYNVWPRLVHLAVDMFEDFEIEYQNTLAQVMDAVAELLDQPAPELEVLRLTTEGLVHVTLPPILFCGYTPRLKKLSLEGDIIFSIQPISPLFCDLRELSLSSLPPTYFVSPGQIPQNVQRLQNLCHLLHESPNLQRLHISQPIRRVDPATFDIAPSSDSLPVALPGLTDISFKNMDTKSCLALLRALSLPLSVSRLVLDDPVSKDSEDDVWELMGSFMSGENPDLFYAHPDPVSTLKIVFSTMIEWHCFSEALSPHPIFGLKLGRYRSEYDLDIRLGRDIPAMYTRALPVSHVQDLTITFSYQYDYRWLDPCFPLENVSTLRFDSFLGGFLLLAKALACVPYANGRSDYPTLSLGKEDFLLFPELRSIYFDHPGPPVRSSTGADAPWQLRGIERDEKELMEAFDHLKMRARQRGSRLRALHLSSAMQEVAERVMVESRINVYGLDEDTDSEEEEEEEGWYEDDDRDGNQGGEEYHEDEDVEENEDEDEDVESERDVESDVTLDWGEELLRAGL
ncbi:uncharacterized protein STEHIDRAFT_159917 [Stereum hirsutum FP-91666 SS1]|uniref:uncharacterized protein n=1 Tax=Stereum hirsutum (strain FP-91666) TaxID=721885 RepID=UPI000444A3E8|nr:uncharacterized protein STEHIDRAFT_159917 [Stereum hirsutum FP-91666 SS1]EIM83333.1 hypothetical protein STEHIDRAFT_159917 [Stereum hirsutum FP-91666 SS1]